MTTGTTSTPVQPNTVPDSVEQEPDDDDFPELAPMVGGDVEIGPGEAILTIEGRDYDLAGVLPITLGDWEKLEQHGILKGDRLEITSPSRIIDFLHLLVQKLAPDMARESIMSIPMGEMPRLTLILQMLIESEVADLRPIKPSSSPTRTSSRPNTGGR